MLKLTGLLIILSLMVCCAGVIADTESPAADSRLTTPITIDCVGIRLHEVTERLTAETGVDIKCGSNKDDYTCRDIPIFVSVKELPLGTMLRTLADVTHLELGRGKLREKTYYRIYRDLKRTRELTHYFEGAKQARLDAARWDWDTLAAAKNMPVSDPVKNPQAAAAVALANLAASLGPTARDRVLAGESITVKPEEMPESSRKALRASQPRVVVKAADADDPWTETTQIGDPTVVLSLPDSDDFGNGLAVSLQQMRNCNGSTSTWTSMNSTDSYIFGGLCADRGQMAKLRKSKPRRPDPPKETEAVSCRYLHIEEDRELMDKTVKLELPRDVKEVVSSTALLALCKALGYSLIYEDYVSHYPSSQDRLRAFFGKESNVRNLLNGATSADFYPSPLWRLDAKNKLMIGTDRDWVTRYANMVPANVIDYLASKLNGDGVTFDDLSLVAVLTQGQHQEWIAYDKSLSPLRGVASTLIFDPTWRLYFSLPANQRSRMLSAAESLTPEQKKEFWRYGLPLSEVNPDLVAEARAKFAHRPNTPDGFTDPASTRATLRMISPQTGGEEYRLEMTWLSDGDPVVRQSAIRASFPIYSAQRAAELKKAKNQVEKNPVVK